MNTIESITRFLGWCSVLNIGLLMLSSLAVMCLREQIATTHMRFFGMVKEDILSGYFQYLAHYKIATIVLSIVPYFALKIMG